MQKSSIEMKFKNLFKVKSKLFVWITFMGSKYLFSLSRSLVIISHRYFRHREHPVCVCGRKGHNIAAQSEGVQLGVMRQIDCPARDCISIILSALLSSPASHDSWSKRQYWNVRIEDQLTKTYKLCERKFAAVKLKHFRNILLFKLHQTNFKNARLWKMNTVTLLSSYFWSYMNSTTTIYCYYTVNHFKKMWLLSSSCLLHSWHLCFLLKMCQAEYDDIDS